MLKRLLPLQKEEFTSSSLYQCPLLLLALVVGLIVSIFQATTQIQEQTLAFVPKIVAVLLGLSFLDRGCLIKVSSYTSQYFFKFNRYVGRVNGWKFVTNFICIFTYLSEFLHFLSRCLYFHIELYLHSIGLLLLWFFHGSCIIRLMSNAFEINGQLYSC